jgi:hypothetical protein
MRPHSSIARRTFLTRHAPGLVALCALPGAVDCGGSPTAPEVPDDVAPAVPDPVYDRHLTTVWDLRTSVAFDTLCFLAPLTGDPFYTQYYPADAASYSAQLSSAARTSLATIKRRVKDENGNIISAFLCLHLSGGNAETLDALIASLDNLQPLQTALQQTVYYTSGAWTLFTSIVPDLRVVLTNLKTLGFDQHWTQDRLPGMQARNAINVPLLASYNVIAEDERLLGKGLESNVITVYTLYYNNPHGMRLSGTRFVSGAYYPLNTFVQNAAHEMFHPPYNIASDAVVRDAVESMQRDSFVMDKVRNHNASYGYNSLESFMEEDCVRALDQLATELMGIGVDPRSRWRQEDGGMHVFSPVIYAFMKAEHHPVGTETFRDLFVRAVGAGGAVAPGKVKAAYDAFYAGG